MFKKLSSFMKFKFHLVAFLFLISGYADAYFWSSAVPKEVHIVPDWLVLIGEFNNAGVTCATGAPAIFLSKKDPNFDAKVSLALTANASNKRIRVLLEDSDSSNCVKISALGYVPSVFYYYWQLKD